MPQDWDGPEPSLGQATLACVCPRCGQGKLFDGLLSVRDACPVCGLDLTGNDTGDAFAVPILIVLGAIVVGAAFWVDSAFSPPLWVHALIWPVVTVAGAILMTRYIKAFFTVQQYRTRRDEMGV